MGRLWRWERKGKYIWQVKKIFGMAISQYWKKTGQSRTESNHLPNWTTYRTTQDQIGSVPFRTRRVWTMVWHEFEIFFSNLVRLIRTVRTHTQKEPVNRKILDRIGPNRPVYITLSQHTKKVISVYHLPYRKVKFVSVPNRIWERDIHTTNLKSKRLE